MINLYGITIAIGVIIGLESSKKAQLKLGSIFTKYLEYDLEKIFIWTIIPGIIGARIYHVIDLWSYYSQNLSQIFQVWNGGIGIFGGIIGGIIGIVSYLINQHTNLKKIFYQTIIITDLISFALPIGQAIGRFGNYFNQELFGLPTKLPWGIFIKKINRPTEYINQSHFHPLFFYESILNICLFIILWIILNKKIKKSSSNIFSPGIFISIYMIGYGLIRFILNFFRINPWQIYNIDTAQIISVIFMTIGFISIFYVNKNNHKLNSNSDN